MTETDTAGMRATSLSLNGKPVAAPLGDGSLRTLLQSHGYDLDAAMACAVNSRFVPRAQWPLCRLQPGDTVDVVAPVTGG